MQPLHLDYQRTFRPFPVLGAILLFCAVAVALQMARQYLYFGKVLAAWEERAEQVEVLARRHDVGLPIKPQSREQASREVIRANEILRRLTLPWDGLFLAVESAAPKDVALLVMEPDADKRELKIVGEAKDIPALFGYLHFLEEKAMFSLVTLQNHQVQLQDPQHPIRFSLVASWKDQP